MICKMKIVAYKLKLSRLKLLNLMCLSNLPLMTSFSPRRLLFCSIRSPVENIHPSFITFSFFCKQQLIILRISTSQTSKLIWNTFTPLALLFYEPPPGGDFTYFASQHDAYFFLQHNPCSPLINTFQTLQANVSQPTAKTLDGWKFAWES